MATLPLRYRIRTLLLVVAFVALALGIVGWLSQWRTVAIDARDVAAPRWFKLTPRLPDPTSLSLRIRGRIDSRASIEIYDSDLLTDVLVLGPGDVDLAVTYDHYTRSAVVEYLPEQVTEGELSISYRFGHF